MAILEHVVLSGSGWTQKAMYYVFPFTVSRGSKSRDSRLEVTRGWGGGWGGRLEGDCLQK
jgi:hypothetical protein